MKVLIVDDEPLARERLHRLLRRLRPDADCLMAEDGRQAVALVASDAPDLLLLDIRMPGMDGIEVAGAIGEMDNPPAIVFCTAYNDHALEALQHQVAAYLLKPVRQGDLERALQKAGRVNRIQLAQLKEEAEGGTAAERLYITSQSHRGMESVALADVRCFMAEDKYVTAYCADSSLVIPDSLKELEAELERTFVRVHRNALVALQYIANLSRDGNGTWTVHLEGLDLCPKVSRRHLKDVKRRLKSR